MNECPYSQIFGSSPSYDFNGMVASVTLKHRGTPRQTRKENIRKTDEEIVSGRQSGFSVVFEGVVPKRNLAGRWPLLVWDCSGSPQGMKHNLSLGPLWWTVRLFDCSGPFLKNTEPVLIFTVVIQPGRAVTFLSFYRWLYAVSFTSSIFSTQLIVSILLNWYKLL